MKKITICIATLFSILPFFLHATHNDYTLNTVDTPRLITIKEAVALALQNNIGLKKVGNQSLEAKGRVHLATSKILPDLGLHSAYQLQPSPHATKIQASLNVPLIDSKSWMSIKSAQDSHTAAELNYAHESDNLIYKTAHLYVEGLTASLMKNVINEGISHFKRQVQVFEKKINIGAARRLDILEVMFQLNKAQSELILQELEHRRKLGELGYELNLNDAFDLEIFDVDSPYLSMDPQELFSMACETSDMRSLKKEISSHRFSTLSETFELLPRVSTTLESGWRSVVEIPSAPNFSSQAMLNLNWSFLHPSIFANRQLAHIKQENAEYTLAQKTAQKRLGIRGALDVIKAYEDSKISSQKALDIAKEAAASSERMYNHGEATGLEVMDANVKHYRAKTQVVEDTLNLTLAKLKLLFLIGKINEIWL